MALFLDCCHADNQTELVSVHYFYTRNKMMYATTNSKYLAAICRRF